MKKPSRGPSGHGSSPSLQIKLGLESEVESEWSDLAEVRHSVFLKQIPERMPSNHLHHFNHYFALNRELSELYASIALRNFALGLITIFEPIYVFLFFDRELSKTFLFFAAIMAGYGILSPLGAKVISGIGVKHSMLASIIPLFLFYVGLWQIDKFAWIILAVIFLKIFYMILFWPALHMDFARFSSKEKRGREVSQLNVISSISAAISPFFGGLLIFEYGFPIIFWTVLILLFISAIPLFLSREIHERYTDSFEKAFREIFQKKYARKVFVFAAEGIESSTLVQVWPLFLFVAAISYASLGIITSGALILGVIFIVYLGRLTDKADRVKLKNLGAVLNAITWPILIFIRTPLDAFLAHAFHRFTRATLYVPYGSLFYDWASHKNVNRDRFIILREMSLNIVRGLFLAGLAVIFNFTSNLAIAFPIAALFSLAFIFFNDKDKQN